MTTRSKLSSAKGETTAQKVKKVNAQQKVFIFDEQLLKESENLKLNYFHHPGKGKPALFISDPKEKKLFEVKEFSEPHRSWLIDKNICSNGKVYITVPFDCTFLAFHYLKKYCSDRAMALEDFADPFLTEYTIENHLEVAVDVKTIGESKFYKYNPKKTLAWLAVKVKNLADRLKCENIYCGFSSLSQNYKKSEVEQESDDRDYLMYAFDIVGSYVDLELHDELKEYLCIKEMETKAISNKRKSVNNDTSLSKKIKLKASGSEEESPKPFTPVQEKKVTAKEKALAKGAKGTKSISSFFKK